MGRVASKHQVYSGKPVIIDHFLILIVSVTFYPAFDWIHSFTELFDDYFTNFSKKQNNFKIIELLLF